MKRVFLDTNVMIDIIGQREPFCVPALQNIVVHCSATRCNRPFPVTALIRCHAYTHHGLRC